MADVPPTVDYRYLLRLPERKKQRLGTCWACATVAMLEAKLRINDYWDDLPSIQNLIDCCLCKGSGTRGGTCSGALEFIQLYRLATHHDCPEKRHGDVRRACSLCDRLMRARIMITGHGKVEHVTELNLQRALAQHGALCVGVTVGPEFDRYTGGVTRRGFHNPNDRGHGISGHYLTLCGYNTDPVMGPYWILLNSYAFGGINFLGLRR